MTSVARHPECEMPEKKDVSGGWGGAARQQLFTIENNYGRCYGWTDVKVAVVHLRLSRFGKAMVVMVLPKRDRPYSWVVGGRHLSKKSSQLYHRMRLKCDLSVCLMRFLALVINELDEEICETRRCCTFLWPKIIHTNSARSACAHWFISISPAESQTRK